jgi:RecB family exonuclease
MENDIKNIEKFSYSKISLYEQCPFRYKLVYKDKHYIHDDSIATDFGTLIHYIEELMAKKIVTEMKLDENDYAELIKLTYEINLETPSEKVYGANILREKYKNDWFVPDKTGRTYEDKLIEYLTKGIYRLRNFLIANPDYEIFGIEQEFSLSYNNYLFQGFIDRIYRNVVTGELLIEDIKTWKEPAKKEDLTTPLQFVIYSLACQQLYNIPENQIKCAYELPLCDIKQDAGSKGFFKRGIKKLDNLLQKIESNNFEPNPSPLCHWCPFCKHVENQKEEAKNLCPYYSLWRPDNKVHNSVEFEWMGMENHEAILQEFINKKDLDAQLRESIIIKPTIQIKDLQKDQKVERYFLLRR